MNKINESVGKLKDHGNRLKKEVKKSMAGYILGGLGVVAAFAWNDAIKGLIEYVFPMQQNSLLAKFGYAFLLTLVVVLVSVYVVKWLEEREEGK